MSNRLTAAVIFDIDGTLSDCTHRRGLVEHDSSQGCWEKANWAEFFRRIPLDPVVVPVRRLLLQLWPLNHVVLCTGRGEEHREITVQWLSKYGIPYSALFMRPAKDYRPDNVVKRELLEKIREMYEPWLVVDDRNSVVAMWRDAGLTCLQCAPGDF